MEFQDFKNQIKKLKEVKSQSGIIYTIDSVTDTEICGVRQSTKKPYQIKTKALYEGYIKLTKSGIIINTTNLKPFVDRVQSPSLAILKGADLI